MSDPRRTVLVSPLGTGPYGATTYTLDGEPSPPTRFIQSALAHRLVQLREQSRGAPPAVVVLVLVTSRARDVHGDAIWEELTALSDHNFEVRLVDIADLDGPEAYQKMQQTLVSLLRPRDRVTIDITHGFRATAPLLLAAMESLLSGGKIDRIERVTYGMFDRDHPEDSSIWDISHALTARSLTAAVRSFREHGHLLGIASALGDPGVKKACQGWQQTFDAHQLSELPARSQEVVEAIGAWKKTLGDTPDPLALLCQGPMEQVVEVLAPLAGAKPGSAQAFLLAGELAMQFKRLATAVMFTREAVIQAFSEDYRREHPSAPDGDAKIWERAFSMVSAENPEVRGDSTLLQQVFDTLQRGGGGLEVARAFPSLNDELRNPIAHCWLGREGSPMSLESLLRRKQRSLGEHLMKGDSR